MTLAEFKAWFEGFTEAIEGAPTPSQWERIKEQVAKITAPPIFAPPTLPLPGDDSWKWRNPFVTTSYASKDNAFDRAAQMAILSHMPIGGIADGAESA